MTYRELKDRQQKEIDSFPMMWACSIQPLQIEQDPRLNKGFCKAAKELEAEAE